MTPIIAVEGLSKAYVISHQPKAGYSSLRDDIAALLRRPFQPNITQGSERETLWALRDVSFDVQQGDIFGVIGSNGAGKSTLLKILSRITYPTEGRAVLRGRVGSLLEVGTGFHPELTGRENVFLNGAILGMRKQEIEKRFDEIVAFSEIERFLDTPVKFYSSGMYVRLAFAVAAHLEPDVLIVDEVLSVGDARFQKKSLGKMGDAASSGTTVLLVSHNMAAIENLCSRAMFLEQGRLRNIGETTEVIEEYLSFASTVVSADLAERTDRQGDGRLRFTRVGLRSGENGQYSDVAQCGQDLEIVVGFTCDGGLKQVNASMAVYTPSGQCLIVLDSDMAGANLDSVPRHGRFSCRIERLPLAPGQYFLNLFCTASGETVDWVQNAATFNVEAGDYFGTGKLPPPGHGGLLVPQEWSCDEDESSDARRSGMTLG
ncbi:MAG: ABC transporter ATP-binding protein [Gaiellaceae bacterium]|jgi:lipopolysaccharide transport system ATP-binding protein